LYNEWVLIKTIKFPENPLIGEVMSIRQQVFDYIKNNTGATVDELKKAFSDAKERTLVKYLSDYKSQLKGGNQKETATKSGQAKKISNRQQVFDYLAKNINTKLDDVKKTFPEVNKGTISDYYYRWKRGLTPKKQGRSPLSESLKSKVYTYLNENPSATAAKLQKAFEDAKIGTLRNLRSQWQKMKPSVDDGTDKELINALKKTVAAQEKAIQAMQKTIDIISSESRDDAYDELEGMSLDRVKKIAATYLRGLRELPETFRRR